MGSERPREVGPQVEFEPRRVGIRGGCCAERTQRGWGGAGAGDERPLQGSGEWLAAGGVVSGGDLDIL